jgi:hypothetical protein
MMDTNNVGNTRRIITTTHQVRETIMSLAALQGMAEFINDRDRKVIIGLQHDRLCPPLGQTISACVVPLRDGHFGLEVDSDIFPEPSELFLPSGEIGFQQHSEKQSFPLTAGEFDHPANFSVSVDPTGLGGFKNTEEFFEDLRKINPEISFDAHTPDRRSQLPDAEAVFTLGLQASALWFGVRFAKAAADAIEPELKKIFQIIIAAIKHTAVEAIPKFRPVTYVLQVHGDPNLEFVAKSRDANAVIAALAERDVGHLRPKVESLRDAFKAEMIQFRLGEDGNWAFNYLLTKDGKVIGTKIAFDYRSTVFQEMESERQSGTK